MLHPKEILSLSRGPFHRNKNGGLLRHLVVTLRNGKVFIVSDRVSLSFNKMLNFFLSRVTLALFIAFGSYFDNLFTY